MAYIGAEPVPGQNREVDDISSGFNGNATAFTLQVNSVNVSPESAKNILVNLGGVLQNPDTDYTINASTLTFTTAPASGLSFFGLILGAGINTATVADGAITTAKLASDAVGANQLANTSVTAGSYTTADITVDAQGRITAAASGTISGAEIADQAVTNAKVNNSAAIAGSKISPDFGSQNIVTTGEIKSNTLFESASGNDLRLNAGSANRDIFFQVNDSTLTTVQGSTGNVGIGTSSPSDKLHVRGASAAFTAFILDNATNSSSPYKITYGDQGQVNHLVVANRELTFGTNNAERVRIDSSGRLLLGASTSAIVGGGGASLYQIETTSQNAISCVAHRGTGNASGSIFILGKSRGTSAGAVTSVGINDELGSLRFAGADDTDLQSRGGEISCEVDGTPGSNDMPGRLLFKTTADGSAAPTERMRIDKDGNVGIGTTSPQNMIHTSSANDSSGIRMTNTYDTPDNVWALLPSISGVSNTGFTIRDVTDGRNCLVIDGSGRVGIGTSSPNETLTIINSANHSTSPCYIKANGSNNVRVLGLQSLRAATSGGIAGSFIEFFKANGSAIGSVTGENSISYNTTSDYRLKENVVAISDGITRLKTLKPSRFNWIVNPSTTVDGFLAHEVTAVPEAISGTKDEVDENNEPVYQGIDQSKLVPLLTAALQEEISKREALETRVAALEAA